MVLKRLLFVFPLLFASCAVAPSSAFTNNVYALGLGIPAESTPCSILYLEKK